MPRKSLFDQPPENDPFLPNSVGRVSEKPRIDAVKQRLHEWVQTPPKAPPPVGGRPQGARRCDLFLPYLLIRSYAGDTGGRPFTGDLRFASPDIWIVQGPPEANVAGVPIPTPVQPALGLPYTVYAHVWNLGRAPIVGVMVEFYLVYGLSNSLPPVDLTGGPDTELLGIARVDLPPRSSLGCHQLVKCPNVVVFPRRVPNFEFIVVRASAIGDLIGQSPWDPVNNRHVAVRLVIDRFW